MISVVLQLLAYHYCYYERLKIMIRTMLFPSSLSYFLHIQKDKERQFFPTLTPPYLTLPCQTFQHLTICISWQDTSSSIWAQKFQGRAQEIPLETWYILDSHLQQLLLDKFLNQVVVSLCNSNICLDLWQTRKLALFRKRWCHEYLFSLKTTYMTHLGGE